MAMATYRIRCGVFQNILYAIHTIFHNVTTPKDSYSMFQYWDPVAGPGFDLRDFVKGGRKSLKVLTG